MKQNESSCRYVKLINFFILLAALLIPFVWNLPEYSSTLGDDYSRLTKLHWDAAWYARDIDSGIFSNWHSLLLLNEISLLGRVLGMRPLPTLYVASWIAHVVIILCSLRICSHLSSVRGYFKWVGCLYSLFFLIGSCYLVYPLYAEQYMVAALMISIVATMELSQCRTLGRRVWGLVLLIALYHVIGYRKNAVLLLPVFFYYVLPSFSSTMKIRLRVGFSLLFAVLFFCFSFVVNKALLQHNKVAYPAIPMLVSDMKMAAMFRGELNEHDDFLREECGLSCPEQGEELVPQAGVRGQLAVNKKQWESLLERYVECCLHHPLEMFGAHLLTVFHLYVTKNVPESIRNIYNSTFPALEKYPKAWNAACSWYGYRSLYGEIISCLVNLGLLVCGIGLIVCKSFRIIKWLPFMASISIVYMFSFLPVTPGPYSGARYMYPVGIVGMWVLSLVALQWYTSWKKTGSSPHGDKRHQVE